MHRLRVPRPEPGRRRAAPAQHAPQHQRQPGTTSTSFKRRRPLRHCQPGQFVGESGHQTRDGHDDIQWQNELHFSQMLSRLRLYDQSDIWSILAEQNRGSYIRYLV